MWLWSSSSSSLLLVFCSSRETSHLFYFLSFILTVEAGIGNALAGPQTGWQTLQWSNQQSYWISPTQTGRRGETSLLQGPLNVLFNPSLESLGGYSRLTDHFLSLKSRKKSEEGEKSPTLQPEQCNHSIREILILIKSLIVCELLWRYTSLSLFQTEICLVGN